MKIKWTLLQRTEKKNDQRGLTFVELMFVSLLLPILGFVLFGVLAGSNQISRTNDVYTSHNDAAMAILRSISREVGQSSSLVANPRLVIGTGVGGTSTIRFQIPVDWDNDGDVVTAASNPATEWGAYTEPGQTMSGNLGYWISYQLSSDGSNDYHLQRKILDAALTEVADTTKTLANNVQTFTVSRSGSVLTLTMTVQKQEPVSGRTITGSFTQRVLLRNSST